jgi:hypothetical protein
MVWPAFWLVQPPMRNSVTGGRSTQLFCPTDRLTPLPVPADMRQIIVPLALLAAGVREAHLVPAAGWHEARLAQAKLPSHRRVRVARDGGSGGVTV